MQSLSIRFNSIRFDQWVIIMYSLQYVFISSFYLALSLQVFRSHPRSSTRCLGRAFVECGHFHWSCIWWYWVNRGQLVGTLGMTVWPEVFRDFQRFASVSSSTEVANLWKSVWLVWIWSAVLQWYIIVCHVCCRPPFMFIDIKLSVVYQLFFLPSFNFGIDTKCYTMATWQWCGAYSSIAVPTYRSTLDVVQIWQQKRLQAC